MAAGAVSLVMNHDHLPQQHPFFSITRTEPYTEDNPSDSPVTGDGTSDRNDNESHKPRKATRKRNAPTDAQRGLMAKFTGKADATNTQQVEGSVPSSAAGTAASLDADPNLARRKRRKTDSTSSNHSAQNTVVEDAAGHAVDDGAWRNKIEHGGGRSSPKEEVEVPMTSPIQQHDDGQRAPLGSDVVTTSSPTASPRMRHAKATSPLADESVQTNAAKLGKTPPRKMLRLNAEGGLGSPPAKRARTSTAQSNAKSGSRQKNGGKAPGVLIVSIRYGKDEESKHTFARQIDSILKGEQRHPPSLPQAPPRAADFQKQEAPRPKHPLFMSKAEKQAFENPNRPAPAGSKATEGPPRKAATTTPGKLRTRLRPDPPDMAEGFASKPLFGDLRPVGLEKYPGSVDAAWPWKDCTHTRGFDGDANHAALSSQQRTTSNAPKRKHHLAIVDQNEDIVHKLWAKLQTHGHQSNAHARLPQRLLTNGEALQKELEGQIHTSMDTTKADRWLRKCFSSLRSTLTPFDLDKCEQHAWAQKYAPQTADEVLQTGGEVLALRDWLRCLTVTTAESTLKHADKAALKMKKRKKRRRQDSDLDGFIVDDDDAASLDELTDPEDGDILPPQQRSMLRTISSTAGGKLANVVLLSGPQGCGKTAAVFAVAKELDFEVFEVNPGTRRSGKDIMDRVGDMTENHLVRQVAHDMDMDSGNQSDGMEAQLDATRDRTREDIDSGRQATMASFFKATKTVKPKTLARPKASPTEKPIKHAPKATQSRQRQSLILLEEVDVLFEEDQGFWSTVRALAAHSRRPIILTCNDESLVNIEEASLHAILRFKQPPVELATDYMLLIAACEGHVLQREAVHALLESRHRDLRASITELNFWCQMAIGDTKGGLQWMYQRWPPGHDVDEQGRRIRVASKDTYLKGMGWFGQETIEGMLSHYHESEALLREGFNLWNVTPESWLTPIMPTDSSADPTNTPLSDKISLVALEIEERRAETLSAIDCIARLHHATPEVDPSLPNMSAKARESFIEGYRLLEAEPIASYDNLRVELACQATLLANAASHRRTSATADFPDPSFTIDAALEHVLTNMNRRCEPPSGNASLAIRSALEPLAAAHTSSLGFGAPANIVPTLTSLDRPISVLTVDIAPYVRSIAAYDMRLEAQRLRLSSLLSEKGNGERRMRKTRAARSALEGGRRETTRRERWFRGAAELNLQLVLETGGKRFAGMGLETTDGSADGDGTDSLAAAQSVRDGAFEDDNKSPPSSL